MKNEQNRRFSSIFAGRSGFIITVAICVSALMACIFAVAAAVYVTSAVAAHNAEIEALNTAAQASNSEPVSDDTAFDTAAVNALEAQDNSSNEAIAEINTEPDTEAVTEPVAETAAEAVTETVTEAITEPVTEAVTESETEAVTEPEEDKYIVVLDAGHGYDDPGTDCELFGDWSEKNITLDIALRVGRLLEAAKPKAALPLEIFYTRTVNTLEKSDPRNVDGYYVLNPYMREDYIKTLGSCDAIVSIHCDSYEQDSSIDGVRVFYCRGASDFGSSLAVSVRDGIFGSVGAAESGTEPEVQWLPYDDAYYITKCTEYPSILIETGFVTNKTEAENMMTAKWRQKMAQGIADGILSFLGIE